MGGGLGLIVPKKKKMLWMGSSRGGGCHLRAGIDAAMMCSVMAGSGVMGHAGG